MADTKKKKTAWENECEKINKKIDEITLGIEANIVATLYAKPELLYQYELGVKDFNSNVWRVFFAIIYELIINEKKNEIDELVVGFYLQKHAKLSDKYESYGGWNTIQQATQYIKVENFESQYRELHKWNTIKTMLKQGFPIAQDFSKLSDLSLDEIYDLYNAKINHIFANADCEVKSYDITDGLSEYIDELDNGVALELPVDSAPILNNLIGTFKRGQIYGLGASTGVGKTTMAFRLMLPSIIKEQKKVLILLNESDQKQVQLELLIYVANNIFKKELHKKTLRDGHFTQETKDFIKQCVDYIKDLKDKHIITIVPLESFSMNLCIKLIQKYSSLGVEFIILDTFKTSVDKHSEANWEVQSQDVVKLYDICKPASRNLCLLMTYQLTKGSLNKKYLTNNDVGQSKSILDTMSVNMMMRRPFQEEFDDGKNPLICYRLEGQKGKSKIPFKLSSERNYLILWVNKNRNGETNPYQIVYDFDMSTNTLKELGICSIAEDMF